MGFELLTIGLGAFIVYITKGSFKQLVEIKLHWWLLAIAGLVFRIIAQYAPIPESQYDTTGLYILLFSFFCLLAFCFRNILKPGFAMVTLGVFSNFLVTVLNSGMPVDVSGGRIVESPVHQNATNSDVLGVLGDIFSFDLFSFLGIRQVISIGDIMLGIGIIMVMYFNSRVPKTAGVGSKATDVGPMITPDSAGVPAMQTQSASFGNAEVGNAGVSNAGVGGVDMGAAAMGAGPMGLEALGSNNWGADNMATNSASSEVEVQEVIADANVDDLMDNKKSKKPKKEKKKKLSRKEKKAMKEAGLLGTEADKASTPGVGYLNNDLNPNILGDQMNIGMNDEMSSAVLNTNSNVNPNANFDASNPLANSADINENVSFVEGFVNNAAATPSSEAVAPQDYSQTMTPDQNFAGQNLADQNVQQPNADHVQYDIAAGYAGQETANMSDQNDDGRSSFDLPFGMQQNQVDQTFADKNQYLSEADQIDAMEINDSTNNNISSSDTILPDTAAQPNVVMGHMQMPAAPAFGLNEETDFEVPIDNTPVNSSPVSETEVDAINTSSGEMNLPEATSATVDFSPPATQPAVDPVDINPVVTEPQPSFDENNVAQQSSTNNFDDMFNQQLPPVTSQASTPFETAPQPPETAAPAPSSAAATSSDQNEADFWGKKDDTPLDIDDFYASNDGSSDNATAMATEEPMLQQTPQVTEPQVTEPQQTHPQPTQPQEPSFQPSFASEQPAEPAIVDSLNDNSTGDTFDSLSSLGPINEVEEQTNIQQPTFSQDMSFQPPVPQFQEVQTSQNTTLPTEEVIADNSSASDEDGEEAVPLWRPN